MPIFRVRRLREQKGPAKPPLRQMKKGGTLSEFVVMEIGTFIRRGGKMKRTGILWFGLSVIATLALLVALGCDTGRSGSADKTGEQKIAFDPKNPCSILTKDEVEAVIKQKVKDPSPQEYACTFETIDAKKFTRIILSLDSVNDPEFLFNGMRDRFKESGRPVKPVAGVGEGAFFYEKALHVLKKRYIFHFQSSGNEGYELTEEAITNLARTAVDKL